MNIEFSEKISSAIMLTECPIETLQDLSNIFFIREELDISFFLQAIDLGEQATKQNLPIYEVFIKNEDCFGYFVDTEEDILAEIKAYANEK